MIVTYILLVVLIANKASADCYEQPFLIAGDSTGENIDFQQNTFLESGTWNVLTPFSPFNFFGTLTTGASVYVGFSVAPYNRLNYQIDTPITQSSQVAVEYWNGANWIQITVMVMQAQTPYNTFANVFFQNAQCETLILGETPGWTAQTLNGIGPDWWIRFRIISTLSADVVIEQLIRYQQEFEVDAFGYTHYTNGVVNRMGIGFQSPNPLGIVYLEISRFMA